MAITYTAWPTVTFVRGLLASTQVSLPSGVTDDIVQSRIDSRVAEVGRRTRREFLTTTETRQFNGSGTGEMVVSDYRSISAIQFYLTAGIGAVSLAQWQEVSVDAGPKNRIHIFAGPAFASAGYYNNFPEGRSNVAITATWGYADSIPQDVWNSVAEAAAADIVDGLKITNGGVQTSIKDDDVTLSFSQEMLSNLSRWGANFEGVCKRYTRDLGTFMARKREHLI